MEFPFEAFTERDCQTTDNAGTVRFAMIGLGWWTRTQAVPAIEESTFGETTVLLSGSKEKFREETDLAGTIEHGITYEEFDDGVAADAYDAVYICTSIRTSGTGIRRRCCG